jgi:mevalonate pyrophosphate decarboxylase
LTDKETLFLYRLQQAEETLAESKKMIESNDFGDFGDVVSNYAIFPDKQV